MDRFIVVDKKNINEIINKYKIISCKLRNSRIKAKQLGIMEIIMLGYDLNICFLKNGPLGDVKGIVSFLVPNKSYLKFISRLNFVGYFNEFYIINFDNKKENNTLIKTINPLNFKGLDYSVNTLLIQDENIYKHQSPHNRPFKIISNEKIKDVIGYRGTGRETGRRALPVEDARCMVNLSMPFRNKTVLDPFAGAGGIVYICKYINPNINITSIDIDKTLEPGLKYYGAKYYTDNSATIKLKENFDAIITEVPFSPNVTSEVVNAFKNLYNNLNDNGIIVLMCSIDEFDKIKDVLNNLNCYDLFSKNLNRKGTLVKIGIFTKDLKLKNELYKTILEVEKTY